MRSVRSKSANKQQMGLRFRVLCSPAACVRACFPKNVPTFLAPMLLRTQGTCLGLYDMMGDTTVPYCSTVQYSQPSKQNERGYCTASQPIIHDQRGASPRSTGRCKISIQSWPHLPACSHRRASFLVLVDTKEAQANRNVGYTPR
jgi:hypothetical protein